MLSIGKDRKCIFLKKPNYLIIVWIVMAISGVVFIEPAPMDLGIIMLLVLGILLRKLTLSISNPKVCILLFVFLLANVISFFGVSNSVVAFRYFLITLYLILSWLFYIFFVTTYREKAVKILFSGYTFAAVSSAFLGLLAYFSIIPDNEILVKFGRISGFFKDPNVFGPFMIPIALYSLSKLEESNKKTKWLICFLIVSISVLLSYSRAAWGCYAVALAIYYGLKFIKKPNFKILAKVVSISLFVGIILYIVISIPQINQMLEVRFAVHSYDTDRFAKQDQALTAIPEFPLGIGPGQTEITLNYATHNGYLRVWLENGFIGFFSYLLFVISSLFISIKRYFDTNSTLYLIAAGSIVSLLINSFVIDTIHWRHLWFILAIPWFPYSINYNATNKIKRRSKKYRQVW